MVNASDAVSALIYLLEMIQQLLMKKTTKICLNLSTFLLHSTSVEQLMLHETKLAFCNLSREGWPTKPKMAASKLRSHHHLRYFLCTTSFSWFNLDDPEATHAACSRPWPCCVLYCEATTWFRGKSFFFLLFLLWLPFSTTFLYSMMIFVPVPSYRYFLFHILFFIRKLIHDFFGAMVVVVGRYRRINDQNWAIRLWQLNPRNCFHGSRVALLLWEIS